MDEMMRGQRGWRELSVLGDRINKFSGVIESLIWSPRGGETSHQLDEWAFEEVLFPKKQQFIFIIFGYNNSIFYL